MDTIRRELAKGMNTGSHQERLVHILLALAVSVILFLSACSKSDQDERVDSTKSATPVKSSGPCTTSGAGKLVPVSVTASATLPTDGPNLVCDGELSTKWNSGAVAPNWIQLDLGQPTTISKVRLNVAQSPSGPTTHQISAGPTPDKLTLVEALDGNTTDAQWIELNKPINNARYLKIETIKSPSWIAWNEIEINK